MERTLQKQPGGSLEKYTWKKILTNLDPKLLALVKKTQSAIKG
ncbi:MAG: hypothetical protein WCD04_07605 [Terriglobia bacterium]